MAVVDGTIVQVTAEYALPESSAMQNVFHFEVSETTPPSEAQVADACELIMGAIYGYVEDYMSYLLSGMNMIVDEMVFNVVAGRWEVFRRIGEQEVTAFNPNDAGHALPPGTAGLAQLIPIYRKHSGYKYIGGFTETVNDVDGQPDSVVVAALSAFAADLIGLDWPIVVPQSSMIFKILVRDAELMNTPVSALVRAKWAYQRRRKKGVGV